jgi:flagellar biosynthesis anti-sigma factor FlgM
MEINGNNPLMGPNSNVHRLEAQQTPQRVQKPDDGNSTTGSDRIELSVRSREILHLDELIQSTPDIREAKVAQIQGAIEGGTYNVRAEQIADKIIGGNLIDEVF